MRTAEHARRRDEKIDVSLAWGHSVVERAPEHGLGRSLWKEIAAVL